MKYYRITYNNNGIYEEFKNSITFEEWKSFKQSDNVTWLKAPNIEYKEGYKSYFKEEGFNKFMTLVYPIIIKSLDKDKIEIKEYNFDKVNIVYEDENQIVIKD